MAYSNDKAAGRPSKVLGRQGKVIEKIAPYMFLLPALLLLVVFTITPIINAVWLMFYDWNLISPPKFVGLGNFHRLFRDRVFLKSIYNTLYFVAGSVPLSVLPALVLAWLFTKEWLKGRGIFEVIYFIPVICGWVEVAMIWRFLLDSRVGLINYLLSFLGIGRIRWLTDPSIVMISVILVHAWKHVGYNTVIFHAAMNSIPKFYYEAAEIDGASSWQMFKNITVPLLMPIIFFVTVVNTIWSFYVFPQVYVLTHGGPGYASYTMVYYLYQYAFIRYDMGYAIASAMVLFALITLFAYLQGRILTREVKFK